MWLKDMTLLCSKKQFCSKYVLMASASFQFRTDFQRGDISVIVLPFYDRFG